LTESGGNVFFCQQVDRDYYVQNFRDAESSYGLNGEESQSGFTVGAIFLPG